METDNLSSTDEELLSVDGIEKPFIDKNEQQTVAVQGNAKNEWNSNEKGICGTGDHSGNIQFSDRSIWATGAALDVETVMEQNHLEVDDKNDAVQTDKGSKQNYKAQSSRLKTNKTNRKKYTNIFSVVETTFELENNVQDVRARFELGCECNDDSCFRGLNPESVYRHRLNIAELTKEEHDMYLMGVTMACMSDPGVTVKRKERQRMRAHYVYQGRRVCLSAFLYLENCTLYQLKRIRKHVTTHGVTPRVHGNHGKKPHNVFSLDIYRRATKFLKNYIEMHTMSPGNLKSPVVLSSDISRKTIHNEYQEFVKSVAPPDEKIMGYSTFRHFMKEQFPNVRFCKTDIGGGNNGSHSNNNTIKHTSLIGGRSYKPDQEYSNLNKGELVSAPQMTAIPVLLTSDANKPESVTAPTYIVTPVQQIVQTQPDFSSYQPHTITVAPISNAAYAFTM